MTADAPTDTAADPPADGAPDPTRDKAALRSELRSRLRGLVPEVRAAASIDACRRVQRLDAWAQAGTVMLYMPLETEVDTTPLALACFRGGRTVCVPKVDWTRGEMTAVEATSFEDEALAADERNLRSPIEGRPVVPSSIDVVVVPGLGFDAAGGRLGRGGGFYDRFLGRLGSRPVRIGIAFDVQVVEHVPREPHDVVMDAVVTDRRTLRRRRSKAAG